MGRVKYRPAVFYTFLVLGAFMVGMIIFNYLIMPKLIGRSDVVIIPDLKGLSLKLAKEKCLDRGLEVVVIGRRNSEETPEGYILEQDPDYTKTLKFGRAVRVIVSAGHRMEMVPELRNRSLRQSELLLENVGLERGRIVRIFTSEGGKNTVASTSPSAGTSVPRSSSVDILLAMQAEPRKFIMPDLVGLDLPFVKDRLEGMGFEVARVVSRRMEEKFPNTILAQNPEAGSCIREGGTIELVVSTVE